MKRETGNCTWEIRKIRYFSKSMFNQPFAWNH